MSQKWLWVGQRLSDGLLYTDALGELDTFFSCDKINTALPPSLRSYSLPPPSVPVKWTSQDIISVIEQYANEIKSYVSKGYSIFPYLLSAEAMKLLNCPYSIFNRKLFDNQLTRSLQMYLFSDVGVRTPRWFVPQNTTWADLVSAVGTPVILQFDNTSSGLGTFCVKTETAYNDFCARYGNADLATEFVDGLSCSAHLFISKCSVVVSSPSVQIIEQGTLNGNIDVTTFSFKGNDFSCYDAMVHDKASINQALHQIGEVYRAAGIYGLLGVDFIARDNMFFYTETNFRLQNSTSLLSFLQPKGNGNIVNCLFEEPDALDEVRSGFQYFTRATTPDLMSGYYSFTGERLGEFFSSANKNRNDVVLIFNDGYSPKEQSLRLIGFQGCCAANGQANVEIKSLIERLVGLYGRL